MKLILTQVTQPIFIAEMLSRFFPVVLSPVYFSGKKFSGQFFKINLVSMGVSISLDVVSIETLDLDVVKEWVSMIEISRSRSRLLNFVSTTMSRPKSLDRDREIRRDLKILAFLDSLWKCVDFCIFSSRFLNPLTLFIIFRLKRPRQCRDFSTNLDCVSTNLDCVSTNLDNLDKNLDASKSQLKNLDFKNLDREKKKSISTVEKISTIQKS